MMTNSDSSVDVTISLVCHNQRHDLERLLPSLLPAAQMVSSEILLVSNRSVDGTMEFVQQRYPDVAVLCNPAVAGYGENHNLNLHRAKGRHFVIMNCDMTVEPLVFRCLRDYMDLHPNIGIVSPRILNEDGSIQGLNKRYPTFLDLFLRGFVPKAIQPYFQRRLDYYEMRDIGYEQPCDVPFLSGAFMFCRTDVLRSIKGFDQGYFLYFEDVDLCRRVQRTHRTCYYPCASVTHHWKRSAHKDLRYSVWFARSALRYFRRWGYRLW